MAFRPAELRSMPRPSGLCRRCGGVLPADRRWQCVGCDAAAVSARPVLVALPVPTGDECLAEVCDGALLHGRVALDDPGFPVDEWSRAPFNLMRGWTLGRGGVWVYGNAGSGKTTLLAGLVLRLRASGVTVVAATMAHLLAGLRTSTMADAGRYAAQVDRLGRVQVLALDDVLVRPLSEWAAEVMEQVLNARWNAGLPVLATSNHALSDLPMAAVLRDGSSHGVVAYDRLFSRLRATCAQDVACFYPGDRRTGRIDEALAARWRANGGAR